MCKKTKKDTKSVLNLIRNIQAGSDQERAVAEQKLWDRFYDRLLRYAEPQLFSCGGAKGSASDVVRLGVKSVLSNIRNGRVTDPTHSWTALIYGYVHKKILAENRKAGRRVEKVMDGPQLNQIASPEPIPTEEAMTEFAQEIEEMLPSADGTAAVFREIFRNGHTQKEAAEILRIAERTVSKKMRTVGNHLVDLLFHEAQLAPTVEEAIRLVFDPRSRVKADPKTPGKRLSEFERRIPAAALKAGVDPDEMKKRVRQAFLALERVLNEFNP